MGEKRTVHRLLVGKLNGKGPLGRPKRRWVDNIDMDVLGIGWGDVDWIGVVQNKNKWRALVTAVMHPRLLRNAGKLSSVYTTGGLSSSAQFYRVS
jgi:hypothetical protein